MATMSTTTTMGSTSLSSGSSLFNPTRLSVARRRRGYTKTQLAREANLSVRSITAYEAGQTQPEKETVEQLAARLNFPVSFFYADDLAEISSAAVSFRALSKLTASKQHQAETAAVLALGVHDWISARFRLPVPNLPKHLEGEDPERAAEIVRAEWSLGERPVPHMVRLLEAHGVRVFSLAEEYAEVDAFSFWHDGFPYVFLNTKKSSERSRMDAAHELAHLVLHHRDDVPRGRQVEREANEFASAFLMPRAGIVPDAPRFPSVDELVRLKKRWRVSVAALAYRLHAIGVVSDWHYRSLCVDISRRGFRSKEPDEIRRETSAVLEKVLSAMRDERVGIGVIARDLHLPLSDLSALMFGLAIVPFEGEGQGGGRSAERALVLHEGGRSEDETP